MMPIWAIVLLCLFLFGVFMTGLNRQWNTGDFVSVKTGEYCGAIGSLKSPNAQNVRPELLMFILGWGTGWAGPLTSYLRSTLSGHSLNTLERTSVGGEWRISKRAMKKLICWLKGHHWAKYYPRRVGTSPSNWFRCIRCEKEIYIDPTLEYPERFITRKDFCRS